MGDRWTGRHWVMEDGSGEMLSGAENAAYDAPFVDHRLQAGARRSPNLAIEHKMEVVAEAKAALKLD